MMRKISTDIVSTHNRGESRMEDRSSIFDPQSSTFSSNGLREFLRFKPLDSCAEPILDCVFGFPLVLIPFQIVDGSAADIQRNVVARHLLCPLARRNEINERAFGAGMSSFRIAEIEAAWRILKNGSRLPGCFDRTAVTTLLDEVEFSFQHLETVAIILIHKSPPRLIRTFPNMKQAAKQAARLTRGLSM